MTPEQRRYQRRRKRDRLKTLAMVIAGTLLLGVTASTVVLSLTVIRQSSDASASARVSCHRTREFGPPIGKFLNAHHALPARAIVDGKVVHPRMDYAATIPKSCP